MVIIHQNNREESMLLKMGVRICPSFWYQMDFFRVLAHGLHVAGGKGDFIRLRNDRLPVKNSLANNNSGSKNRG